MNKNERSVICIDMRSFYASCMAVLHQLDVEKEAIAVVAHLDRPGSVVLAASPPMKERFQIRTGSRLYEIPNDSSIYLFEPRMSYFMDVSVEITRLLHNFVPLEAIHVYSVDESFVDLTGTCRLWGPPEQTARHIQEAIVRQFGIPNAVGMGPNKLLAKLALDLEAKRTGFAKWTMEDVPTKLWPVTPLSEMWGIGHKMEQRFNALGIETVGELANYPVEKLEKLFGVMGLQHHAHANGRDYSPFERGVEQVKSYGKSQILLRDYHEREEINAILLEMCEDVAKRMRDAGKIARKVSLSVGYSRKIKPVPFLHRSLTLPQSTGETLVLYRGIQELFNQHVLPHPVRQLGVSVTGLEEERLLQLDLFDPGKLSRHQLARTMDELRGRYGTTSVLRAVSYLPGATLRERASLVGGHKG